MDFRWINGLGVLAQTGNFSQAAALSNISQPAFSRRIKALEEWVGAKLVDRSAYPVRLTPAGAQILEAGQQAIDRIETEVSNVREAAAQPDRYMVRFAAQHSISWRFFPAWLQAFESAYGAILSRLRADDLPNCLEDLSSGAVDFVIAYAARDGAPAAAVAPDVVELTIGHDQLVPVCKPRAGGAPLFDLRDRTSIEIPFLRFGNLAPLGPHVGRIVETRDLGGKLKTVYENSMAGALRIRARDGLGLAWLPRTLVQPDLESGLLVAAGGDDLSAKLDIRIQRLNANTNGLVRQIWAFLEAHEDQPLT